MRLALVRWLLRRELRALERRMDVVGRFDQPLSAALDRVRAALDLLS